MTIKIYTLIFISLCNIVMVNAATYIVDKNHPNASDTNPGTELLPWKTIQRAAGNQSLSPGDIVLVKDGIYTELNSGSNNTQILGIRIQANGTPDNRITFKNFPGHKPIIDQEGGTYSVGFMNEGTQASYITIDGFEIRNTGNGIFLLWGNPIGFTIQNNYIHHMNGNPGSNVAAVNNWGGKNTIVRNNIIHTISVDNDFNNINAGGIITYSAEDMIIENNEIYNTAIGIRIKRPAGDDVNGPIIRRNILRNLDIGINYSEAGSNGLSHGNLLAVNNLMYNVRLGIVLNASTTLLPSKNISIYNNTILSDSAGIFLMWAIGVNIYNNITITASNYALGEYSDRSCTRTVSFEYIDYNAYGANSAFITDGWCESNQVIYPNLNDWKQISGYDSNSLIINNIDFVDTVKRNYRLAPASQLNTLGRNGAAIGAYNTQNIIIGSTITLPEIFINGFE